MNNLRKVCLTMQEGGHCLVRRVQSNASLLDNCVEIRNRNPRNLELLTIARKPVGFHLDKPGYDYWHKIVITTGTKHVTAKVNHFKNGPVVMVSTSEWALKKQLYKSLDVNAFTNLGKVLAQRCLESGIGSVYCDVETGGSKKLTAFVEELKKGGVALEEPPVYKHAKPWDSNRMVKPWTIEN